MARLGVEACASVADWPAGASASTPDFWQATVLVYDLTTGEPRDNLLQENFEWVADGPATTFVTSFAGPSSFMTQHGLYTFSFDQENPLVNIQTCVAVFVTVGGDRGQALTQVSVHGRPHASPNF
jgi:hypothetical protein